ncbi:MAG: hypothetical protein ACKVOO_02870 [Burkholderiaceae bacterium]
MLELLKKAFGKQAVVVAELPSRFEDNPASVWASARGLAVQQRDKGKGVAIDGTVMGKAWRLEIGKPSRHFIRTEELRARSDLGLDPNVGVLIMNRHLKQALEKQAYERYTDTLQTQADVTMPEEIRWLSVYDEFGWESLPNAFWDRYCVLADDRANALAWLDAPLAELLMSWPALATNAQTPFMLLLLRGKAYLRMEYQPATVPTLQHASGIFTSACESALGAFGMRSAV